MTAPSSIDPTRFLHEQLGSASPDLLRSMLTTFMNTLMSAEADAVCGAPYGETSPERTNVRNGYRHREFDTRAGTFASYQNLEGRVDVAALRTQVDEQPGASPKQTARALLRLADTAVDAVTDAEFESRTAELEAVSSDRCASWRPTWQR